MQSGALSTELSPSSLTLPSWMQEGVFFILTGGGGAREVQDIVLQDSKGTKVSILNLLFLGAVR